MSKIRKAKRLRGQTEVSSGKSPSHLSLAKGILKVTQTGYHLLFKKSKSCKWIV
jgi:hypothetical protein